MGQIGSVYKQPEKREDDSCHSWRAPSKWKRGTKGSERGNSKGSKGELKRGQNNHAMYICNCNVCAKNDRVLDMLSRVHMTITRMNVVLYIRIIRMNVISNLNSV